MASIEIKIEDVAERQRRALDGARKGERSEQATKREASSQQLPSSKRVVKPRTKA